MPSGLPTAPDEEIGFQPPPIVAAPIHGLPGSLPDVPFIGDSPIHFNPVITVLIGYLEKVKPGALDEAVAKAYKKIPQFMDKLHIKDAFSFIDFANDLLKWTPHENFEGKDIYDIICMFYFVLDQEPLHELQTPIHPNQAGQPLTWLSSWIVVYAQLIGLFMDTPASITAQSLQSFKDSPKYKFHEALVPPGGFRTFNEFFSRHLKPGMRPIEVPHDDRVIVYPADCTYDNSVEKQSIVSVEAGGIVYIKNLPWTIGSLLQGSEYARDFEGGIWMHAFLNTFNYHRQHAPVAGTVIEAKNIQGAAYLEVNKKCQPIRVMCGPDAPDSPGYQFLQTRGMVVIENPVLGKVAVLPIGMAQVSSVKLTVKKGDVLKKGDEISYFQFGGSDVICVFQGKAGLSVEDFVPSTGDTYSNYGTVLAVAPGSS
ncbi:phosphatidylserine decarboxylase-domain-containing protein [Dactylonectria macrodidyma]|uniref:Phosphatidylserine decarboxylase-domain-containing protein n=1 Tax=Dactylonectria macrodidyma TaxID=307937 RepID=A0A9P9FFJ7_9HYPO|nr:phosphatidylserine decarboxylase-domain-containing protein [Dactylonectria macrodidyma]